MPYMAFKAPMPEDIGALKQFPPSLPVIIANFNMSQLWAEYIHQNSCIHSYFLYLFILLLHNP